MKPNVLCANTYTIRKVGADGKEVEMARFHNVPLQNFYDAVIGRYMGNNNQSPTSCIHSVWFGTGSSTPSESDTGLESPLWTYGWNYSNVYSWEKYLNEQNHICHKYTFKIEADAAHVGTVSEVGVCIITGKGYLGMGLATHALILDAEGNPITITKTDLEALYVDVIFEFTLTDSENFKWVPENYINYGASSGTGWGPIFTLALLNRIFFFGKLRNNGFSIRHTDLSFSKSYHSNNREMQVEGARLPQSSIPSQRYIKAIGIGNNNSNTLFGYWTLPDADIIPPKALSGMNVGVGDGTTKTFNAPIAEWVKNSESIYVDDVQKTRGVDYTCSNDANSIGIIECSILQDMEYIGAYTSAAQNIITPIAGVGPYVNGAFQHALWNYNNPALVYAFPENAIKPIKRLVFKNFINYLSLSSGGASYDTNWSGKVWTIEYSDDNSEWTAAGTATMDNSQQATITFAQTISARYWRFTISGWTRGILFAAQNYDSIMAYGEQIPITFASAPADGAVITMDATVNCPMKNSNFIIDVNPTFTI